MLKKPLVALLTNNDDDVYCFRLELIQAILEAGYRIIISCPDGPKFEALEEDYGLKKNRDFIYDEPIIDRRGTNVINDSKLMIHYWRLFKKFKPKVILTYTAKPNVYASMVAHQLDIPVINNVTGFGSVLNESKWKQKFIMWLFKLAYSNSACIMFQNSTNMKLAQEMGMVRGESKLIPGSGVNIERYPVQTYPEGGNGISGAPVVFNYIGRILRDKGVDDYITAAKRIKQKYPNTEFNMVGFIEPTEKHYEKELKELGEQNIVYYRGNQKDVKPWIQRAHCIIHPSTYGEGMSNVLLENASSGRPIITTDNPGCKETVDDGVSGFVYQGGNVEELTKIIVKFLKIENAKRQQMGLLGRKRVAKNFNRKIVVGAYLKMIKTVIRDKEVHY